MNATTRPGEFSAARAIEPDDRVERRGEALVLMGARLVRLSAIAVTVYDACAAGWVDVADLDEALVEEFGPSGLEGQRATRELLVGLAEEGLVGLR